jgi:hypothetical protein
VLAEEIVVVPILTIELLAKLVPKIVTVEPADPSTGENELIVVATKRTSIGFDFISNSDEKEGILRIRHNKLRSD